jgi:hypothetical protein
MTTPARYTPTPAAVKRDQALREAETAAAAIRRAYVALRDAGDAGMAHETVLVGLAVDRLVDRLL